MSTDGGSVWTEKDSYYSDGYDLVHGGGDTFWCCGYKYSSGTYYGVISETSDAGDSWTRHTLFSGTSYGYIRALGVDPADQDRVYGLGYLNSATTLFYTHDGGATWEQTPATGCSGTPYAILVNLSDGDHLAAATSSGLYHSTDGGTSWTEVSTPFSSAYDLMRSIYLGDVLVASSDGVWHWEWSGTPVRLDTEALLSGVNCLEEGLYAWCFAGTNGNAVWKAYYGLPVESGTTTPLPDRTLGVFPNPATAGAVRVDFVLSAGGSARLSAYDLSGRLVIHRTEQAMAAGENSLLLDTSAVPPGVYILRLESSGSTVSTRMVVTSR